MIDCIEIGISCAVVGFTFVYILCDVGEIFGQLPPFIESKFGNYSQSQITRLFLCPKCFSGQLALWVYPVLQYQFYNLFAHILTISIAILTAYFTTLIANKLNE